MYTVPTPTKYDFWIKNKYNVLFIGKHGIGKTESVKEKFDEHYGEGNWLYFSASTMDPWVDFVGVPKEVKDADGNSYLELIRPKALQNDKIKAIMCDEYNRAPAKVRNAIMELVQFKSINGKKFNNLEVIWAAINPDDDDSYDVEKLDPAQRDRFQVVVNYPYVVNRQWFMKKYGSEGETICAWWDKQDEELRNAISPRRLSYAMDMFLSGGDLSDVLPYEANIEELVTQLTSGSYLERLKALFAAKDDDQTREAFQNENFFFGTEKAVLTNKDYLAYFVPKFPKERLVTSFLTEEKVRRYFDEYEDYRNYQSVFDPIIAKNDLEQRSILSLLNRWKARTVSISTISDVEFIDMISDNRRNIDFLSNDEKQKTVINKFGQILSESIVLQETYYRQMFGVMCELYVRVDESLKHFVLKNIRSIKQISKTQGYAPLEAIFNDTLPGLRRAKTGTVFEQIREALIKAEIIDENRAF